MISVIGAGWFIDDVSVNGCSGGLEAGTDDWDLGGWTWTTGLHDNDWGAVCANPDYIDGAFSSLDYQ